MAFCARHSNQISLVDAMNNSFVAKLFAKFLARLSPLPPFHHAATLKSPRKLTRLISSANDYEERIASLLKRDQNDKTVLHHAASQSLDHVKVVLESFKTCCPEKLELLKANDNSGKTAFHYATRWRGGTDMLTYLIEQSLESVECVDDGGNYEELCAILNIQDNEGKTILHYASKLGLEPVQVVLESFKLGCPEKLKLLKHQDKHGVTAFHSVFENTEEHKLWRRRYKRQTAVNCKFKETMAYLLKSVQCVENTSNYDELCEILNLQDDDGKTVLHYAAERELDYVVILLKLFNPGCRQKLKLLKERNKWNETAFHIAASQRSPETLKYLFKSIDSVDEVTNYEELPKILNSQTYYDKKTVLHCAAERAVHNVQVILESFKPGCPEILELLKARDRLGKTVFHRAACYHSNDMVKCLLEAISNNDKASNCKQAHEILNLQDDDGKTALHYAAYCSPESISLILMFYDTNDSAVPRIWSVMDNLGQTFVSYVTDVETLRIFKDKLTTDMWVELVTNIDHGRSTWIHKMMMQCNIDCLDFILRSLSADVTLQLLKAEDETHSKPLDKLGHEYSDMSTHEFLRKKEISLSIIILVMELVNSFEEENWFFLVESLFAKNVDELHNTHKIPNPANRFIYHLHLLTTVTERVTYEKQLKLLGETNDLDSQLRQQAKSCRV